MIDLLTIIVFIIYAVSIGFRSKKEASKINPLKVIIPTIRW